MRKLPLTLRAAFFAPNPDSNHPTITNHSPLSNLIFPLFTHVISRSSGKDTVGCGCGSRVYTELEKEEWVVEGA